MLRIIPGLLVLAVSLASFSLQAGGGREAVVQAAERFASAVTTGEPSTLHQVLPRDGKILVSLAESGSSAGYYGASQVVALFGNYLAGRPFSECTIEHLEVQESSYARVDLAAVRDDRTTVYFRIALHREQERWVLRELRESSR